MWALLGLQEEAFRRWDMSVDETRGGVRALADSHTKDLAHAEQRERDEGQVPRNKGRGANIRSTCSPLASQFPVTVHAGGFRPDAVQVAVGTIGALLAGRRPGLHPATHLPLNRVFLQVAGQARALAGRTFRLGATAHPEKGKGGNCRGGQG